MHPRWRQILIVLFVLAALVRVVDVWRPVDGSVRDSWREPDVAGIARNFYLEGMNIFYPRIDWRGDGPGFVESEFPLPAWMGAAAYHVCGYHEELLRVMSYLFSLGATAVFFRLAWTSLPARSAFAACVLWTVSPIGIRMASAIQPEPLMFLGLISAVLFFREWCQTQSRRAYWLALGATMLAVLAKVPAAHIGLLFAALCLQSFGWSALKRRDVWGFVIVSLGVPLLWYAHARTLWLSYGNSLGISNEAYGRITSMNFFSSAWQTMPGVLRVEIDLVWTLPGLALGLIGLWVAAVRGEQRWIVYWAATLVVFYFVTGRTTGEDWAWHYHIASLPVACLLMGAACGARGPRALSENGDACEQRLPPRVVRAAFSGGLLLLFLGTVLFDVRRVRWDLHPSAFQAQYECASRFRSHIAPSSLIVSSGAAAVDQFGLERAFNAPYMFFWTRTKGFTLADSQQSIAQLEQLRRRGAKYFIAESRCLKKAPGFESELRSHYRILDEHPQALLVELTPHGG